ncbi:MAG TPA: tetratricopeptide repeat protein [Opitutaceae bacterium]|nr:tetratricopeptide repeat protein [Opitutaceae bacterium]
MTPSPAVRSTRPAWANPKAMGSAGLLLAATLLVYLPVLRGGLLWDDDAHVTKLPLRSLHGLARIWFELGATQQYYPILHSAFWIEHRLWGDSVLGYHLANVLLHATAAWLLVLILRRLAFPAAWLAGLLFALHPVCVESVAWIAEQKNTLSAVFYLGAALIYLDFDRTRRARPYFFAFGLFVLALLTKSVTASLPAALLLVFWWRRGRIEWKRDVRPLLPWFAIGTASGLFTAWIEQKFIGAEGADFSFTALQRLLLAGRVIIFYLGKLIWPGNLIFIYPRWSVSPHEGWQYLYIIGVLGLLGGLLLCARRQRGPLAGFLFFVGTLFPVLGFVNVYPFLFSFVADHFQYLACLGLIVPAAWGLAWSAERIPLGRQGRICLLLALPAVLAVLSWSQCRIYRDADTLNRATLARNPAAWLAHYNLAVSLGSRGRLPEAISEYKAALQLKPDHWAAHNNLAGALLKMGEPGAAIIEWQTALRLNPGLAEAHNNLGVILGRIPGRAPEAISHLRTALRIRPDFDDAHNNLGVLLMRGPDSLNEAIVEFTAALRTAPDNPEYHYNLANALAAVPGRLPDAITEYRTALRLNPNSMEAHSNLGAAWARLPGHLPDAASEYEAALRIAPENARIHANLANALARIPARAPEAISEYATALRIDPDDAETHNDLGVVLSDLPGRREDAMAEFQTAIRLKPEFAEAHFCLGIVLLRNGNGRKEAIDQFEQALRLRPDFEPARKILAQLKESSAR